MTLQFEMKVKKTLLKVVVGDITQLDVDAIVNAANKDLLPGGGVCGAIHRAAGPQLAIACEGQGGCSPGWAKVTPGFDLPVKLIIHAVGPVFKDGLSDEDEVLRSCYRNALALASNLTSIALPAISTGIYRFPLLEATKIAVHEAIDFAQGWDKDCPCWDGKFTIIFSCFSEDVAEVYARELEEQLRNEFV